MKKLLLVLITVFGSFLCSAQFNTYHPFPHNNASWCQTTYWLDQSGSCVTPPSINNIITEYYDFYANGDTVANANTYIEIRTSGGYEFGSFCPGPGWIDFDVLSCLIREDTAAKKVYIATASNGWLDLLLYDFTLTQGDYLPTSYVTSLFNDSTYVYSIDSILVGSSYRKQFIIAQYKSHPQIFDSIVEGIGSMKGLIRPIMVPFEGDDIMTGFVNGSIIFPFGNSCSRYYLSAENVEKPTSSISIYPNPSTGIITLALSHPELVSGSQTKIEIYNVLGATIYTGMLKQVQHDCTIDLSNQPNGIYLYRVVDETSNLIGERKLVIQK